MKINLVCDDPTWIYGKFVEEFKKHSENEILLNAKSGYDLVHYIPYYNVPNKAYHPSTCWHSHQELKNPLKEKFISSAKQVDCAISQSKKYADLLIKNGIKNVIQIVPGIDLDKFQLRKEWSIRTKLIVGCVGRAYKSSNRKNLGLLDKISKLPIELRMTGGVMPAEKLPEFYSNLDLIVSPSTVEGGPMSLTEGLACGIPSVCYDSVGVVNEFEHGVIRVPFGNENAFIDAVKNFRDAWTIDYGKKLRSQVEQFTWKHFVNEHDKVWKQLYESNR